jgi:hypothetical protein
LPHVAKPGFLVRTEATRRRLGDKPREHQHAGALCALYIGHHFNDIAPHRVEDGDEHVAALDVTLSVSGAVLPA